MKESQKIKCSIYPIYNKKPCWNIKSKILSCIARWHPKNWHDEDRTTYPQLWYCMPSTKRFPRLRRVLQFLCGLTRHELSNTEWGYGGGKYADRWCRWCDKLFRVPKESVYFEFKKQDAKHLMSQVGRDTNILTGE